jgi:hypothetical protein
LWHSGTDVEKLTPNFNLGKRMLLRVVNNIFADNGSGGSAGVSSVRFRRANLHHSWLGVGKRASGGGQCYAALKGYEEYCLSVVDCR